MNSDDRSSCFHHRLADADLMVCTGFWASGHAVASRMLECARSAGCTAAGECAAAAGRFIEGIRGEVAA